MRTPKKIPICEGKRGGNICGRKAVFLINNRGGFDVCELGEFFYSCEECPGRILIEHDIDDANIERLYQ